MQYWLSIWSLNCNENVKVSNPGRDMYRSQKDEFRNSKTNMYDCTYLMLLYVGEIDINQLLLNAFKKTYAYRSNNFWNNHLPEPA